MLYSLAVILLSLLAWNEYYQMLKMNESTVSFFAGLFGIILIECTAWLGNSREILFIIVLFTIISLAKTFAGNTDYNMKSAAFTLLGILYIGLLFSHLILLRMLDASIIIHTIFGDIPTGAAYIWLAFIGTWASDTFAYFVGCKLGKNQLCAISPSKTREGAIGGFLGCIATLVLLGYYFNISIMHSILLGIIIGIAAPCGDLVESAIKRYVGVKDSGKLLPGHGGVLDRFDSIIFAVPAAYYYIIGFVIK